MDSKTATAAAPQDIAAQNIAFTLEDVACLGDGTGDLPEDTAARLQVLICCQDLELVQRTWRRVPAHLEALRQMAADAGVKLLADGLYVFRGLEQLRSEPWESPADVLDPRLDVPYQELIAMARALADRARGSEQAELRQIVERLIVVCGDQLGGEVLVEHLIHHLLEAGEQAAEEALSQLVGIYRHRRAAAVGRSRVLS